MSATVACRPALALLMTASLLAAADLPDAAHRFRTVELRELLGREPEENTLKLFRAVVDADRQRVYVAGIMSRHLAVLDSASETWVGNVDSRVDGYALKYLAIDPTNQRLWVRDATHASLSAIDLASGQRTAVVATPATVGAMLPDPGRGLLYLLTASSPSFRALDATTLVEAWATDEMGPGVNQAAWDEATDTLLVLDGTAAGPAGRLYRLDPASRRVLATVALALPPGERAHHLAHDPVGRRLVVSVGGRRVRLLAEDGALLAEATLPAGLTIEDLAFEPANRRVVVTSIEPPADGQVAGRAGRVLAWDAATLAPVADLPCGRKIHSLAVDGSTGRLYLPNGDASVLWRLDPDLAEAVPLRLGDSLEQIVPVLGGQALVVNSRLGGSYLMSCQVAGGAVDAFTAGTWPVPIRADAAGQHLLALNAWDSTVSVLALAPPRTLLATVPIGLPEGSTDRLPDLAVDSDRRLAFAAYPEHGQIAVVDWAAMTALAPATVPGLPTGDTGGGPGQLQLELDPATGRLFALASAQRRVLVYDASAGTPVLLGEVELPTSVPLPEGLDAMLLDAARGRLFVGPAELDGVTGEPTGRALPRGDRVFAVDPDRDWYWAWGLEGHEDVVLVLDRDTLEVRAASSLGSTSGFTPSLALDPVRRRLYVGRMTTVELEVWALAAGDGSAAALAPVE